MSLYTWLDVVHGCRNAQPENPPEGYIYEPMCVRLDEQNTALQLQAGMEDVELCFQSICHNFGQLVCVELHLTKAPLAEGLFRRAIYS